MKDLKMRVFAAAVVLLLFAALFYNLIYYCAIVVQVPGSAEQMGRDKGAVRQSCRMVGIIFTGLYRQEPFKGGTLGGGQMIQRLRFQFVIVLVMVIGIAAVPAMADVRPADYEKNRWNFVEGSMDVSGGIPEDAEGRLGLIRDAGKLRVATEPYFAPQEFIDPSLEGQEQFQGADMELARLIAERMGVELEIVPLEFTKVLSGTADGTYDLAISGLAYTPSRANSMELSKGYHFSQDDSRTGFLIRKKDAGKIQDEQDLVGRDIAAQAGSLQELLASENVTQYRQFIRLSSMEQVYGALEEGIVDAAVADIETARLYIEKNPSCGLMILEGVGYQLEDELKGDRIAAPEGEAGLAAFVNGVIDEILKSGQYEEWFDEYHEYAARLGL